MASALTEEPTTQTLPHLPFWHPSAPRRVVENCRPGNPPIGWTTWQRHLSQRKRPIVPPFLSGSKPAVAWCWPQTWGRDDLLSEFRRLLDRPNYTHDDNSDPGPRLHRAEPAMMATTAASLPDALRLVALSYSVTSLAETLMGEAWWQLVERLGAVAAEAQTHPVDWPADPQAVVCHQLVAGELSLTLSYLLPELAAQHALRQPARDALSEALLALTDGEGLPHARLLPVLGPLVACWTRCRWLGKHLNEKAWSDEAEVQYMWLVRHAVRLTGGRCQFVFAEDPSEKAFGMEPMFATALELVGDKVDRAIAKAILPKSAMPAGAKKPAKQLPKPSLDSDWSGISVLAQDWSKSGPRLVVTYADEPMRIDFTIAGRQLLSGTITSTTHCDGQPVQTAGQWEQLCWHSDKHCDYLELGVDLEGGLRLERQLVLPRSESVLFLADVVLCGEGSPRTLQHSLRLPIGPNVMWQPEAETRDGVLVGSRLRAAVLPLGLFEWRCDPRGGSLQEEAGRLTLSQESTARALYCPLLLDFKSSRATKERTWRHLTVAEALEIVPRDVAVAYRAQSGRRQWLVYRSLAPAGNRTFLGQNISGEFCAGHLPKSGEIDEWIEVEACS